MFLQQSTLSSSSSSSSLLFFCSKISSSTGITTFLSFSFPLTHHFKRLQSSPTTTYYCIHSQSPEFKCSEDLKIVRDKKLLSELCTWGIGGPCNYFIEVFNHSHLLSAIRYCRENSIEFVIVGKGSNCLFDDNGFDGCVILNRIEFLEKDEIGGLCRVGSGYPFNRLGVQCSNEGFTGLEFAGGIPGTVGGAAYMNAGADGQETADTVESVEIVTINGRCQLLNRSDLTFGYRSSSFQDMEDLGAITAVTFHLKVSSSSRQRQKAYLARRRSSQPVVERSAGSVFRNPSGLGVSAGELIEKAGLKGFRVGGAKVSDIHANFFINSGSSASRDMLELIEFVKQKVDQKFGIQLKEEIRYVSPYGKKVSSNRNNFPADLKIQNQE